MFDREKETFKTFLKYNLRYLQRMPVITYFVNLDLYHD